MKFEIELSRQAGAHLSYFSVRRQAIILKSIEEQLSFEPTVRTKHRKHMRPNSLASWELRIRDFRVFYDVSLEPNPKVSVLAVGVKRKNKIEIGGEEFSI